MEIQELNQNTFADIFSKPDTQTSDSMVKIPSFGSNASNDTDLFNLPPKQEDDKEEKIVDDVEADANLEDTTKKPEEGKKPEDTTQSDENTNIDADLTSTDKKTGRKPKYDFSDASGYFEDRFKSGKFVAITEELEDGTKKPFIPKTPEEFDEVIDIQVNYQLEQKAKELEQKWYATKSPAWQAVAKYAEMTDDPTEVIPFLQGVQTIESVAEINENEVLGAEQIVRIRLERRGEPQDLIDEQIEALKSSDRLVSTAQKYKPVILREEQQHLAQMVQKQKQDEEEYIKIVETIKTNAIKAIEAPLFGKVKLKHDEKVAVYQMIGEPDKESTGYRIYSQIDSLFDKGDFETLKEISLLLTNRDSFMGYIHANAANKVAGELQRKLKVATDSRSASSDVEVDDGKKTVSRTAYTSAPRFGR